MQLSIFLIVLLSNLIHASLKLHWRANSPSDAWDLASFSSFVTFGDSYTDENRLNYFGQHNGVAPPPGTILPESLSTSSGGRIWARYVVQYTGDEVNNEFVPRLSLYNYAVSGSVCSNDITPRLWPPINASFPSVREYEVPAFITDKGAINNDTGQPTFTPPLNESNTVYTLWIGTNDLGVGAFITDSQVAGKTLTDYTDCLFSVFDSLYMSGGRFFILNNILPLYLTALYANESAGGLTPNKYWPNKPSNQSAIAEQMKEYVTTVNNVYEYQLPYEVLLANRYPDASFALYDVNRLVLDIYNNPTAYLNGSAPANVTGFEYHCDITGGACTGTDSPDSFLWYDELHPSEQTDRIIARNFVDVISGNSSYATYY